MKNRYQETKNTKNVMEMNEYQPELFQLELQENDVLCTKDKSLRNHPGNCLFRAHIDKMIPIYREKKSKLERMNVTRMIVDDLRMNHSVRFVKFDDETASWVEVEPTVAREKVGHAIRSAMHREEKKAIKARKKKQDRQSSSGAATFDSSSDTESIKAMENGSMETIMENVASSLSAASGDKMGEYQEPSEHSSSSGGRGGDDGMGLRDVVEPMENGESSKCSWTSDDVHFLLNETELFGPPPATRQQKPSNEKASF